MQLYLYSNYSKRSNSTKHPNGGSDGGLLLPNVILKNNTDIYSPVMLYRGTLDTWTGWTYAYAPQLGTYYFVRTIVSVSRDQWEIALDTDVLATYKQWIGETIAYVERAATGYDPLISDGYYVPDTTESVMSAEVAHPIINSVDGSFIICCMSDTAPASYGGLCGAYQTSRENARLAMQGLASMYSKPDDVIESIKKAYNTAFDAFISCNWIPFRNGIFGSQSERVRINGIEFCNGYIVNSPIFSAETSVAVPHAYEDFRADSPFSSYELYLPMVGTVTLPASVCAKASSLTIRATADFLGNISYIVKSGGNGNIIGAYAGNGTISIPINVASMGNGSGIVGGMSQVAAGALTMIGGAVAANPLVAAGGAAGVISGGVMSMMSREQTQYMTHGSLSGAGAAGAFNYHVISCICRYHPTATSGIATPVGRAVMTANTIGYFDGYVKTRSASVDVPAPEPIRAKINALLDGGIYYE